MPVFAQDLIHKLEVGSGYRVLKFAVGIVAIVALGLLYDLVGFQNFSTAEAMDAAQLARNISAGEGFTTKVVRPLSLYLLKGKAEREVGRDVPIAPPPSETVTTGSSGAIGTSRPTEIADMIER